MSHYDTPTLLQGLYFMDCANIMYRPCMYCLCECFTKQQRCTYLYVGQDELVHGLFRFQLGNDLFTKVIATASRMRQ
jgi:hypothetical protein